MKAYKSIIALHAFYGKLTIFIALIVMNLLPIQSSAQADSTKQTAETTEEVKEGPELISPSIEFIAVQKADNTIDLKVAMKAKVKGVFYKLPKLKVTMYHVSDTAEKNLGSAITDHNGKAVINTAAGTLATDKEGKLHFKVVYAGNKSMEAGEEELFIKRARLIITPVKEDSVLSFQAKLVDLGSGTETPVPELTIGIYAKRLFNPLKLGEGTTDENGEATIEIPNNLPGDAKGNITFLGRLDENETYGNLEASVVQKWGKPISDKIEEQPRALWSSHPPLWMLITFIILMSVVWGHYLVIVYQLIRLRKEEPAAFSNTSS